MIVPMFKYSYLVFHAEYTGFLEHLKELGVVHIVEHQEEPSLEMQELYRHISDLSKTIKGLKNRKKGVTQPTERLSAKSGEELSQRIDQIHEKLELLHQKQSALLKEEKLSEPWGEFSLDNLSRLEEATNLSFRFLVCPIRKFEQSWIEKYPIYNISDAAGYRYFVLIDDGTLYAQFLEEAAQIDEVGRPTTELADIRKKIQEVQNQIRELNKELDLIAFYGYELLNDYKLSLEDQLNNLNVKHQTIEEAEGKVRLVEGWVPADKAVYLEKWLDQQNIYYIKEEASREEKPPILLKNNSYARLFEPVGKLFSLPAYGELDLTPFFAPFFMMFFGFCLGDAGYGLLFIIIATLLKRKAEKSQKPLLSLVQWLGIATVLFGAITGTLFGIQLSNLSIPWLSRIREMFLNNDQMFTLSLILGGIQILFGMILKGINQIKQNGFAYSLATWGWFLLITSFGIFYMMDKQNPEASIMWNLPHQIITGIALLGIFVFNNPKRNVFINIGLGIWDAYNMITGVIGDLLSYIRLFALGLSSAILGLVFNQLAFELKPDIPVLGVIITLLILLIGHGINIFMSGLGSFVHPLRLTFVEFYKNAGFIGGGKEYKPFQKIR